MRCINGSPVCVSIVVARNGSSDLLPGFNGPEVAPGAVPHVAGPGGGGAASRLASGGGRVRVHPVEGADGVARHPPLLDSGPAPSGAL